MFETLCKIEKIFIDILLVPSRHDNFSPRQSYYKNYYTLKKNNRDLSNIVMQIFFFSFSSYYIYINNSCGFELLLKIINLIY